MNASLDLVKARSQSASHGSLIYASNSLLDESDTVNIHVVSDRHRLFVTQSNNIEQNPQKERGEKYRRSWREDDLYRICGTMLFQNPKPKTQGKLQFRRGNNDASQYPNLLLCLVLVLTFKTLLAWYCLIKRLVSGDTLKSKSFSEPWTCQRLCSIRRHDINVTYAERKQSTDERKGQRSASFASWAGKQLRAQARHNGSKQREASKEVARHANWDGKKPEELTFFKFNLRCGARGNQSCKRDSGDGLVENLHVHDQELSMRGRSATENWRITALQETSRGLNVPKAERRKALVFYTHSVRFLLEFLRAVCPRLSHMEHD